MMKIHTFPTDLKVSGQLFHVPGAAVEGGFTAGSVRIMSPEPGGRSVLEVQLALRNEWDAPWMSWLMSKTNGQAFRVRLTKTPQLITSRSLIAPRGDAWQSEDIEWRAPVLKNDLQTVFTTSALEGSNVVVIDISPIGPILQPGHVIGHLDHSYMCDDVEYISQTQARITVTPPLRKTVTVGNTCLFTPWFLGTISNGSEITALYESAQRGHLQPGKIVFSEMIL